ncbi:hypothetical protein [Micromonospora rifamycinica]|uniref:Zinc-finger n=1 Tax=Micromonospora rifamycinica TaxID=291594 RepID=A0A109IFH3_9ACTN|nr:hypothetical protein [Micromonospora rifamycinica]KWV29577.1 hypothetical protein AWV63_27775 [Micromonospora rifamycinica]SCG46464.1 hypothetical protein GA0070623_1365 [Micromonospora rifamycinica]
MTDLRSDSDAPGPVAHPQLQWCAPYLWGDLDPQDEWDFERHLGTCAVCLDECDRLGPLVGAFSGFTTGEVADLLADADTPDPTPPPPPPSAPALTPPPTPTSESVAAPTPPASESVAAPTQTPTSGVADPSPEAVEPATTVGAGGTPPRPAPPDRRPPGDPGPAGRGPGGRGSDRSRRGRRRWLVAGTLAVVAAVSLGVTIGQWQQGGPPDARSTVNPVNAGVTVEGAGVTARLSVTVVARPDGSGPVSGVRATVVGLTAGVDYRLYAVAADTRTYQVAQWTATAGPQEVTGEIPVALETLAFFAVAEADGTAVVSARIGRPTGPR